MKVEMNEMSVLTKWRKNRRLMTDRPIEPIDQRNERMNKWTDGRMDELIGAGMDVNKFVIKITLFLKKKIIESMKFNIYKNTNCWMRRDIVWLWR